ncbi:MAG: glycosyltransferase family 4 protein [Verrucomicrobia bacterium]|nr:glycosyltransferase family 4 protein [Verrucomicrobiota bacterium]
MHYLFIYSSPGILGGIETLIARMSRWLIREGNQVTFIAKKVDDWGHLLPKEVQVFALGPRYAELYYYFHAGKILKECKISPPDVIKSFDVQASWIACQMASFFGNRCKVIAGNYNPFVFRDHSAAGWPSWERPSLLFRNFFECIPPSARLFCGQDQLDELRALYQQSAILWPLPMDANEFLPAVRQPKAGKIVSVGRLSPMKEYNFYMIDIVRRLLDKGHAVTWSVYGKGEFEAPMRDRIRQCNLENAITLEGEVPYNRFWQVLADASVFVGMGTSIFEAALFKVPNITAAPFDLEGLTWGPVYQFPKGSLGPADLAPPRLKVIDEIERILSLSPSGYRQEAEAVYKHVQEHEMQASMQRFLEAVRDAQPVTLRKWSYLAHYPLGLLRRARPTFYRAEKQASERLP